MLERACCLAAGVAVMVATSFSALARKEVITVKLGTIAPEGTPWSKQIERAKKDFSEQSRGRLKLKAYTGFAKGGEHSIARQCIQGSLQMCGLTTGALAAIVNELNVLELPYLFSSAEEADRILDGPALPQVKKILAAKGFVFYAWSEHGWRSYGTRERPIRKPADLKGLKVRSQASRVHVETHRALGASAVPLSAPEVVRALQTGAVDAADISPLYMFVGSWYKHIKYFTQTRHIYQPGVIVYSKVWFDKLPGDLKKVLLNDPEGMADFGRKLVRKMEEPMLDNLKSMGIKIIRLTPGQRAPFAAATYRAHRKIRKTLSPAGRKLLDIIYRAKRR